MLLKIEGNPGPTPRISLAVASEAHVALRVHDSSGRIVTTLQEGIMSMGMHSVEWVGRNASGLPVHSGIYFARLEVEGKLVDNVCICLIR